MLQGDKAGGPAQSRSNMPCCSLQHDVAGNIEELFWIKDYEQRQENIEKLSESLKGVGPGSDGCIDVLTDFSGLMEDHEVQVAPCT